MYDERDGQAIAAIERAARRASETGRGLTVLIDRAGSAVFCSELFTGIREAARQGGGHVKVAEFDSQTGQPPIDPDDRSPLLIVSDGSGAQWNNASFRQTVRQAVEERPVAVLHLLSMYHWASVGAGGAVGSVNAEPDGRLRLRSADVSPNSPSHVGNEPEPAISIGGLDDRNFSLPRWVDAVYDQKQGRPLFCTAFPTEPLEPAPVMDDQQRLTAFRMSPNFGALQLAELLSVLSGQLTPEMMELMADRLSAAYRPFTRGNLQEIYASGLLEPAGDDRLAFRPGVLGQLRENVGFGDQRNVAALALNPDNPKPVREALGATGGDAIAAQLNAQAGTQITVQELQRHGRDLAQGNVMF